MNHPSEWARFFDKNTGRYRYKHNKGSGVIRDTFMTIGKVFKNNEKNVAKKTAEKATKTIAEKAGQRVEKGSKQKQKQLSHQQDANILQNQIPKKSDTVEKGSKRIRKILQERKKRKPLSEDFEKETCKYFNQTQKKISRSCEIKSNFDKILIKEKFFFF